MLVVEPWTDGRGDEELGAVRIRSSVRLSKNSLVSVERSHGATSVPWTRYMGCGRVNDKNRQSQLHERLVEWPSLPIVTQRWREFVFEFSSPDGLSASPVSKRITSLNHL